MKCGKALTKSTPLNHSWQLGCDVFIEEFMKTNLKQLFIIGVSAFLLAGCCTTHHVTSWEYKVAQENRLGLTNAEIVKHREALMNDLGKDGWIFVSQSDTDATLYFKRPAK